MEVAIVWSDLVNVERMSEVGGYETLSWKSAAETEILYLPISMALRSEL